MNTRHFEFIEKYPMPLKDDRDKSYSLCLVELINEDRENEEKWIVLCDKKTTHNNSETSYEGVMFFKNNNNLGKYTDRPIVVHNKTIILAYAGATGVFSPYPCPNFKDKICGVRIQPFVVAHT